MNVTPGDLLAPVGNLLPGHFPGEDEPTIETRLSGYITEGNTVAQAAQVENTDLDAAIIAYAYYKAYSAIYVRMLGDPASQAMEEQGSVQTLWQQIQAMKDLADESWGTYQRFIPLVTGEPPSPIPGTTSLPASFGF